VSGLGYHTINTSSHGVVAADIKRQHRQGATTVAPRWMARHAINLQACAGQLFGTRSAYSGACAGDKRDTALGFHNALHIRRLQSAVSS
jgi:hypothetical protein